MSFSDISGRRGEIYDVSTLILLRFRRNSEDAKSRKVNPILFLVDIRRRSLAVVEIVATQKF